MNFPPRFKHWRFPPLDVSCEAVGARIRQAKGAQTSPDPWEVFRLKYGCDRITSPGLNTPRVLTVNALHQSINAYLGL
jgi:hypothetical protein